jgi:hypothetical protein
MNEEDKRTRARVEGRLKKQAATAWELTAGQVKVRCFKKRGVFVVEMRVTGEKAKELTTGYNPHDLLVRTAQSMGKMVGLMADHVEEL